MEKKIKISPKLLRKIELYCILNNIKNWYEVSYECTSCVYFGKPCETKQYRFKFHSTRNFRNFKEDWPDSVWGKGLFVFSGCEKWIRKS